MQVRGAAVLGAVCVTKRDTVRIRRSPPESRRRSSTTLEFYCHYTTPLHLRPTEATLAARDDLKRNGQ